MNLKTGLSNEFTAIKNWYFKRETTPFFYPLLLTIFCLGALAPLGLVPGMPVGHDLYYHLARIADIANALPGALFTVQLGSGIAQSGYAAPLLYPDLFLLIPATFNALGLPLVVAYKLFFALQYLIAAYLMYYAVKRISGNAFTAFAGGMLYMVSSFAASDFYIRAALGETQCFVFFPLILLGMYEIILGNPKRFLPLVIGMSGLLLAHVITSIVTALILGLLCAFFIFHFLREPKRIGALIAAGIITLLLTAYFTFPMLEMYRSDLFRLHTPLVAAAPISEYTVPVTRLFLELPYMKTAHWHPAGIGTIFLIILFYRLRTKFDDSPQRVWQDATLLTGTATLLACTSFLPWEGMFSALAAIQFPWRLYLPVVAFLACGGALAVKHLCANDREKQARWLLGVMIGCSFACYLNVGYIYAAKLHEKNLYRNGAIPQASYTAGNHFFPAGTGPEQLAALDPFQCKILDGNATVQVKRTVHNLELTFAKTDLAPCTVELPLVAYKGYHATIDGKPVTWRKSADQLISITIPAAETEGVLRVAYRGTLLKRFCIAVSWCSALLLAAVLIVCTIIKKRRHAQTATR